MRTEPLVIMLIVGNKKYFLSRMASKVYFSVSKNPKRDPYVVRFYNFEKVKKRAQQFTPQKGDQIAIALAKDKSIIEIVRDRKYK